jgi:hydrogenase/urease accessory protein HupE
LSDVTTSRKPQFSEDRQWWWTGTNWVPAASVPSPSLLTAAALACLGLALLSYVLLPTPLLLAVPITSIFAINVGLAALKSLPKTSMRDRWIAGIGVVLAILPLALIILGIIGLMLFMGYVMVFGNPTTSLLIVPYAILF